MGDKTRKKRELKYSYNGGLIFSGKQNCPALINISFGLHALNGLLMAGPLIALSTQEKKWVKLGSWESPNVTPKLQFTVPIIRSNYFCVVSAWEHGLSSCQEAAVLEALFCCVGGREILVNNSFHLQETHNSLEESSTTTLGSVRLRIGVLFLFWWIMLNHFALNTYISLWHRNLRGSLITGS